MLYNKLYNYVIKALYFLHLCIIRNAGVRCSSHLSGTDWDKANNTYIIEIAILFLGLTGKPITS